MSTTIRMPAFSATMEAGKLLAWLVAPGDRIAKGQVLAEIETDKAVASIEAPEAGRVLEILVAAGDEDVAVNAALAVVEYEHERARSAVAPQSAVAPASAGGIAAATPAGAPPARGAPAAVTSTAAAAAAAPAASRLRASPAARAMARSRGLELARVRGSGPGGRITRADVAGASTDRSGQLRLAMARALVHAKATVPHFYAEVEIELDGLLALRRAFATTAAGSRAPTITAWLIRAAALALREVPAANRYWSADAVQQRSTCHVGCAVGLPDRVALPVVRHADRSTVVHVGEELERLAGAARAGTLAQRDIGEASLTISNLGMHGIDRFFPIVNPPEALMLGIGQSRRVVRVVEDLVGVRTVLSCTASVDHRVVDGELAGRFLQAFKRCVESPGRLAG